MNSARRDLCGGYPVTGIPTATNAYTESVHSVPFGGRMFTGAIKSWLKRVVPSAP